MLKVNAKFDAYFNLYEFTHTCHDLVKKNARYMVINNETFSTYHLGPNTDCLHEVFNKLEVINNSDDVFNISNIVGVYTVYGLLESENVELAKEQCKKTLNDYFKKLKAKREI